MNKTTHQITQIRKLVANNTQQKLDDCLNQVIETGANACSCDEPELALNQLAKASFVKSLMENDNLSLQAAMREMGKRIRRAAEGLGSDNTCSNVIDDRNSHHDK